MRRLAYDDVRLLAEAADPDLAQLTGELVQRIRERQLGQPLPWEAIPVPMIEESSEECRLALLDRLEAERAS